MRSRTRILSPVSVLEGKGGRSEHTAPLIIIMMMMMNILQHKTKSISGGQGCTVCTGTVPNTQWVLKQYSLSKRMTTK